MPDAEWRLIVALWRFGGLRGSSEPLLLKWSDILWDQGKIIVHAKKTKRYEGKAIRIIPIFPELVEPLREAFEQAAEGDVYVVMKHAPHYLKTIQDRSKLDKIKANLGSMFSDYVERAGLVPWSKIVNNLRASMENDLLNGKYDSPEQKIGIQTIASWLGHSPKVMLKHYGRVREDDFKQVRQCQVKYPQPENNANGLAVENSQKLLETPETAWNNGDLGLAVYSTVQEAVAGGIKRKEVVMPRTAFLPQPLNSTAHSGKKQQWEAPCGNLPFSQSGEDRICSAIRNLLQNNELEQRQKSIDSKVVSGLGIRFEDVLPLVNAVWSRLPLQTQEEILLLVLRHARQPLETTDHCY